MIYENMKPIFREYGNSNFSYASAIFDVDAATANHCHKEIEIMYILDGSLKMLYNKQVFTLTQNDIFIVPPYTNHAFLKPTPYCRRHVIVLDMDMVGAANIDNVILRNNLFQELNTFSVYWSPETKASVISILTKMHDECTNKTFAWELAIQTLEGELLLTALRQFPRQERIETDKQISKLQACIEYISINFNGKISSNECASSIGFSPSYFSRFFRENMGMTFQEYVKNSRIEKAKFLLLSTKLSITDICYQSGYSDIRTFNKMFKSVVSGSPSAFRKMYAK